MRPLMKGIIVLVAFYGGQFLGGLHATFIDHEFGDAAFWTKIVSLVFAACVVGWTAIEEGNRSSQRRTNLPSKEEK